MYGKLAWQYKHFKKLNVPQMWNRQCFRYGALVMWRTAASTAAAAARARRKLETWDPVTRANLSLQFLSLPPATALGAVTSEPIVYCKDVIIGPDKDSPPRQKKGKVKPAEKTKPVYIT